MLEKIIKVPLGNEMVDAVDVPVDESNERWTEMKLKDGSLLRIKMSVIRVSRAVSKFDNDGNPLYIVNGTPTMAVIEVGPGLPRRQ